ncbi:bin3-domain-containing protein [Ceraceosorus bombacis]|uniref:RNA methyltransferase n=1 Tax=Ceraceosorus bombacis TaxID=401625 RepID=A0A0P1BCW7_9BASI|nr:bin3-domain-containing protein [Ceraceosorus bombacis]
MAPKRAHPDPEGARARPKHGNFSSYYSIRAEHASSESLKSIGRGRDASESKRPTHVSSSSVDPRLDVVVKHIQQHVKTFTGGASSNDEMYGTWPTRILDVGCNEGRMTCAMASAFPNAQSHGVDIDESLIKRAGAYSRRMGFSPCVDPPRCIGLDKDVASSTQKQSSAHLAFHTADWPRLSIEKAVLTSQRHISDVAPSQHTTELLASRRQDRRELCLSALAHEDDQGWDVILALSITKWIHLSHSDLGIRHFFSRIAQTLSKRPLGGILILEPQPWKSYEQARRVIGAEGRRRHKKLRLRPEDFQFVLMMELGFAEPVRLGQTAGYGA